MLGAIISFFTALPDLLKLINALMGWITQVSGGDVNTWLKELGETFGDLSKAKTQEDHAKAAKALSDLIGRMP
jgi:cobalamin biosynthesis protein CobD/CbiB